MLMLLGNEIAPRTANQTIYANFVLLFGAIFSAIIFGSIARFISDLNQ